MLANQWLDKQADEKVREIRERIAHAAAQSRHTRAGPQLIGAAKGQDIGILAAFLKAGLRDFGENYVQETKARWPELRRRFPDLRLHLIGTLQSNKAAEAVSLFDVIATVDREKIARAIAKEGAKQGKTPRCLMQVNIGEEPGKAGVAPVEAAALLASCREAGLRIAGLMCVPPAGEPPAPYFALTKAFADRLWPEGESDTGEPFDLSMGMSADFEEAIRFGATHIRLGTALFGERVSAV